MKLYKSKKIGLINFFPMRPHVEHMFFLSKCLEDMGHKVFFLSCKGGSSKCYYKVISKRNDTITCAQCKIGGFNSYSSKNVSYIDIDKEYKIEEKMKEWPSSSSYTAYRVEEGFEDLFLKKSNKLYKELLKSTASSYNQTLNWICEKQLDHVMVFNGRMDILRGAYEACIYADVNVNTVERSWFGDGIQFNFEGNCLNLKDITKLHNKFRDVPLDEGQIHQVKTNFFPRFNNESNNEWRTYNTNRSSFNWVSSKKGLKCLILPSSKNEVLGHKDWENLHDKPYKEIFLECIDKLNIARENVILRGHPNWSESIGSAEGAHINEDYKAWAKENNIKYISSSDTADTLSLIKQADVLLLNGSSSAYEAAFLGTPSILISRCFYYSSGITKNVFNRDDLELLDSSIISNYDQRDIIRKAIRFIYTHGFRYPQLNDNVRAISTTEYKYNIEESVYYKLNYMLNNQELYYSDVKTSSNTQYEDELIEHVLKEDFSYKSRDINIFKNYKHIKRRIFFRPVDWIRSIMKRGDL